MSIHICPVGNLKISVGKYIQPFYPTTRCVCRVHYSWVSFTRVMLQSYCFIYLVVWSELDSNICLYIDFVNKSQRI